LCYCPPSPLPTPTPPPASLPRDALHVFIFACVCEFNEIVNALVSQLVREIFTDSGGLRGTSRSSYRAPSYTNRIQNNNQNSNFSEIKNLAFEAVDQSIFDESQYKSAKDTSIASLNGAEALLNELITCYAGNPSFTAGNISATQLIISTRIIPRKNIFEDEVSLSGNLINFLNFLEERLGQAQTITVINNVVEDYQNLLSDGSLHNAIDTINAQEEANDIEFTNTSKNKYMQSVTG